MRRLLPFALLAAVATFSVATPVFCQTYTDDPLVPGTPIKAIHVNELRVVIGNLRTAVGLPAFPFTDPTLTVGVTQVRAVHIIELRTALNDVFDDAGAARPNYADAALAGVLIKTAHIQELRTATVAVTNYLTGCAIDGGPLTNGLARCGKVAAAIQVDEWTFTAAAGDRIAINVGQITDENDFRPWIRLQSPSDVNLGNTFGTEAAEIDGVVAPTTGTYRILVASADSGLDGTGIYRLTMAHTPGPITVASGDEGGPLTNGAIHTGRITQGALDVWTFDASAGDRIGVHIGQITDTDDFRPWIRLWAPNGAILGTTFGTDAAEIDGPVAPVTGTYLVLVASADSGVDGEGTYRLTMTHTPGPITVSPGDDGGPLTNGAQHTGEILQGDLDVWTFTATAGDRIAVNIGQITDTDDFRPWIRLWAPNGAILGDTFGTDAAQIDGPVAPVTGTYLVLVATADSGVDGEGTYLLTMTHTPGPVSVSPGDQGGALTSGNAQAGEITTGDLDVWTITAAAGDHITVSISETTDNNDFRPWIRLWAPNGNIVGNTFGVSTALINSVVAPVSGTYLILVYTADSGVDGTGTYQLTATVIPP